jgi:DNA primase
MYDELYLSNSDRKYLVGRGLSIDKLKVKSISSLDFLKRKFGIKELIDVGLWNKDTDNWCLAAFRNRIFIPYFNKKGEVVFFRSYKPYTSVYKIVGPKNIPSGIFLYNSWNTTNSKSLLVTEGEWKASAGYDCGFNCVGLPGVQCSHNTLIKLIWEKEIQKVFICFDRELDKNENESLVTTSEKIVKRLKNLGLDTYLTILPLGSEEPKRKMDIDSFIGSFGKDAFKKVVSESIRV